MSLAELIANGTLIRVLIVPALALLFAVLPIRVAPSKLIGLAFVLWLVGGVSLMMSGIGRLNTVPQEVLWSTGPMVGLVAAVVIGLAKGRFVLSKTSQRNLARIKEMTSPQKLSQVYSMRSWITIELMLVLSAALTWFNTPMLARGLVNVAVGLALLISSRAYLNASRQPEALATAADAA